MASSLFLLLPISLAFVIAIGVFFWWAIFSGQFDDIQSAGNAVLLDHDTPLDSTSNMQASGHEAAPQQSAAVHKPG